MIKELANEFEGPFKFIGKNSEIYKSFSVPVKKEVIKLNKYDEKSIESISYKIKFIYSMRFMVTSLPNLVDNLSGRISKLNIKIVAVLLNMKA